MGGLSIYTGVIMTLHERMFENIYDLIKGGAFEEQARKEIRQFVRRKEIGWDADNHTISLGRDFQITMTKGKTREKTQRTAKRTARPVVKD